MSDQKDAKDLTSCSYQNPDYWKTNNSYLSQTIPSGNYFWKIVCDKTKDTICVFHTDLHNDNRKVSIQENISLLNDQKSDFSLSLFPLDKPLKKTDLTNDSNLKIIYDDFSVVVPKWLAKNILNYFTNELNYHKMSDCLIWTYTCFSVFDKSRIYSPWTIVEEKFIERITPFSIFRLSNKENVQHVCIYIGTRNNNSEEKQHIFLEKCGTGSAYSISILDKLKEKHSYATILSFRILSVGCDNPNCTLPPNYSYALITCKKCYYYQYCSTKCMRTHQEHYGCCEKFYELHELEKFMITHKEQWNQKYKDLNKFFVV